MCGQMSTTEENRVDTGKPLRTASHEGQGEAGRMPKASPSGKWAGHGVFKEVTVSVWGPHGKTLVPAHGG